MTTTNKSLNQPAHNSLNWDSPLNDNFGFIDAGMGGSISFTVTGVGTSPVAITLTQYQNLIWRFIGTLANDVNYQIPAGIGGEWLIWNNCTGTGTTSQWNVTISSATGGGTSVTVPAGGLATSVWCDGTNVRFSDGRAQSTLAAIVDATAQGTTTVVLTQDIYSNNVISFIGILVNNVTYRIPSPVLGTWVVSNATTGAFTLRVVGNGGVGVTCAQGTTTLVYGDGSGIFLADGRAISNTGVLGVANGGTGGSTQALARTGLGLGTSATQDVGVAPNNVVQLDGASKLPAVDGSKLLNLTVYIDKKSFAANTSIHFTGLDLTTYKQVYLVLDNIHNGSSASQLKWNGNNITAASIPASDYFWGTITNNLTTGLTQINGFSQASATVTTAVAPTQMVLGYLNADTAGILTSTNSITTGDVYLYGIS